MKNLIVNIFKTLFFFDLTAVIWLKHMPELKAKNEALLTLKQETAFLILPLALTLIFWLLVEKRKVGVPINKKVIGSALWGIAFGVVPIAVIIGVLKLFKVVQFSGFNKPSHIWIWIAALFLKVLTVELLFRGYLFNLYKKHHGTIFAVIATTALYISLYSEILKTPKIYRANIILFNILLCFILDRYGSIITTVLARFCYTFISCMLFGSLYSGENYPTILNTAFKNKPFFVDSHYFLEGSKITLVVLILLTATLIILKYNLIAKGKIFIAKFKKK